MPWSFKNHICSGDSTSCMYCLSDIQQAEQVAKLFQSSNYPDSCNNLNKNRSHVETLPILTNRQILTAIPITTASSSLHAISHYQASPLDLQPIQWQNQHSTPPSAELFNESLNGCGSVPIQMTERLSLSEVGDRVSICNPLGEKWNEKTFTNKIQSSTPRQYSQAQTSRKRPCATCECPNCKVEGGNKTRDPNGKLLHVCHIDGCTKTFNIAGNLKLHLVMHRQEKNLFCADCNEKLESRDGLMWNFEIHTTDNNSLYTCRILDCGRSYNRARDLMVHLNWHRSKGNSACAYCNRPYRPVE